MENKKFFNKKVKNNKKIKKSVIISSLIIILLVLIIIPTAIHFNHKNKLKNAIIKVRDKISVEINSDYPDKILFFKELKGIDSKDIKISYKNADIKKIGKYDVKIKIFYKEFNSTLYVIDSIVPELEVKDIRIKVGDKYKATDFVKKCKDNSKEDCKIKFYNTTNEDGKLVNYGNYTKEGKYSVKIIAEDSSNNRTIKQANLFIGKKENTNNKCKFGNSEYDNKKYFMAVDLSNNSCAIDAKLCNESKIIKQINNIMNQESNKLKKEIEKLNIPNNYSITRKPDIIANKEGTGVVGYSIYIELSLKGKVKVSYYLLENGNRHYIVNEYKLK